MKINNNEYYIKILEVIIIYKKILLAIDGSLHSNNAVNKTVEFQKILNCKVLIIHSIKDNRLPSDLYPNVKVLYSRYNTLDEVYKEAGEKLLKSTKQKFGTAQDLVETRLIEDISPEDYIPKIVEEEEIELVVLGSRGHHSKIKKVFLGTVSTNIAKNAPCDVWIVK